MKSAWYFKEPLRNETQNFLISKLCFPWVVYTLTPSNSTHYYLISSNSPFSTGNTKKIPAEKKTTEKLRMYSVTWQSTLDEFVNSHHRALFFIYDSKFYRRLVILWTLDTCDCYGEQSSRGDIEWPMGPRNYAASRNSWCIIQCRYIRWDNGGAVEAN